MSDQTSDQKSTQYITDDLDALLAVLPPAIERPIRQHGDQEKLLEIILDLGRQPTARYTNGEVALGREEVPPTMIEHVVARIGEFDADNRAGMPRTLHRISAIRNRRGHIVGLTCRVGRAVYGTSDIIKDIIESGKSVLMLGKPGIGKCITGDSLVLTQRGLQTLASLIPDTLGDDEFGPAETSVFGVHGLEPASHTYSGGLSATLKITTRQGFKLEGTPEHPVLALTETGDLAFKRLDELKPGDHLAIQRGQQAFGTEIELPVFDFRQRTNALDPQMPWLLDEDLARFLGYLVAEGTLTFDNQVCFSNTDPEVQADMAALTERLFGLRMRRQEGSATPWNGKDFRIFGVKLRRFLLQLGLSQSRAAEKRIPPCILTAPKPVVTAFLQALFEGDGSICGPRQARIEIGSASRRLLQEVHVLLLNYGIVGNLRAKHNVKYDRDYYALTLLGENIVRFAEQIGLLSSTKRGKLEQCVGKLQLGGHNTNIDVVPHQNGRARDLRAHVQNSSVTFRRFTRPDRAPSYRTLDTILTEARAVAAAPAFEDLQAIADAHYFFDPVRKIEEGQAYVYDLTVPGTHSFFANGFVSHNTTMLRESARVLAEQKRVVIVDTSNEIGGDGDIAHPAVGRARRMQVATPSLQHEVMIEAVENHNPQVIIIDEIGRELEAQAARTIAERGVQLIGTAHGNTLENLLLNPTLSDLVGGIESVTLSDEEARRRGTQKTVLERRAPPTFEVLIEIQDRQRLIVHLDVAGAVDAFLRGRQLPAQMRYRDEEDKVHIEQAQPQAPVLETNGGRGSRAGRYSDRGRSSYQEPAPTPSWAWPAETTTPLPGSDRAGARGNEGAAGAMVAVPPEPARRTVRLYPYGVARNRLEQAAKRLHLPINIVEDLDDSDIIVTLKSYYRQRPSVVTEADRSGIPVYVLRSNTMAQIEHFLASVFHLEAQSADDDDPLALAIRETQEAVERIQQGAHSVDLAPQSAYIRRRQHQLARQANLISHSYGKEPHRRVRIYRE